jgi:hypothetical protein
MSAEIFGTCILVETEHHQEMSITVPWNPSGTQIRPPDCTRAKNKKNGAKTATTRAKKGTPRLCSTENKVVLLLGQSPAWRGGQRIYSAHRRIRTSGWICRNCRRKFKRPTLDDLIPPRAVDGGGASQKIGRRK